MFCSIAARFEMDCILDSAAANWKYCVAGFVGSLVDLKAFAAEAEHLRHERPSIELAL